MKILINLTLFLLGSGLLVWAINSVDTVKALELLLNLGWGFFAILLIYSLITWLDTLSWKNDSHARDNYPFFKPIIMGDPPNRKSL